jgi:hypothetical protein
LLMFLTVVAVGFLTVAIVAYPTTRDIEVAVALYALFALVIWRRRGSPVPTRIRRQMRTSWVAWVVVLVVLAIPTPLVVFVGYATYGWIGGVAAGLFGFALFGRPLVQRRRRLRRLVPLTVVSDEAERKAVADLLRAQGIRCVLLPDEPLRLLTDRDDLVTARATLARE